MTRVPAEECWSEISWVICHADRNKAEAAASNSEAWQWLNKKLQQLVTCVAAVTHTHTDTHCSHSHGKVLSVIKEQQSVQEERKTISHRHYRQPCSQKRRDAEWDKEPGWAGSVRTQQTHKDRVTVHLIRTLTTLNIKEVNGVGEKNRFT